MRGVEKAACAKENQANQGSTFEFLQKRNVFFRATQQNQGIVSEKNMINTEQTFENDEARTLLLQFDLYFFAFFSLLKPRP